MTHKILRNHCVIFTSSLRNADNDSYCSRASCNRMNKFGIEESEFKVKCSTKSEFVVNSQKIANL